MSATPQFLSDVPVRERTIIGISLQLQRVVAMADRFAPTPIPVLLVGATGTGKELLAQRIHRLSGRPGELIDINCGALPEGLADGLLFGHRRWAFTDAREDGVGLIARAHRGTLFLDELSSLPLTVQPKLLRVLETGEWRRLGETSKQRIDLRVIAAVQEDVNERLERGLLRSDLYHRIAGISLRLPALAERPDDIVPLAAHFAAAHGVVLGPGCECLLQEHQWPGNVRELRAVVDRAAVLSAGGTLDPESLLAALDREPRTHDIDRERLLTLCEQHAGDLLAVARELGISRATLYRRFKAHRIGVGDRGSVSPSQDRSETG